LKVNPALLKVSIQHKVSYAEAARLADLIEHEGRITYHEINERSEALDQLIMAVHAEVAADQVRRGIIKDGEDSKIIPRGRRFG
jgi:hypothetical protein